jgi:hypothetical protein
LASSDGLAVLVSNNGVTRARGDAATRRRGEPLILDDLRLGG